MLVMISALPAAAQTKDQPGAAATPAPVTTVTVTGKRAAVLNKVDRKVYRTEADLQATTGSANDILRDIPSVEVDPDGTISLRGDSSVSVLINGKPSSQMQGAARAAALDSLSAGDIEQVEIITSPSAEFKPDGSGGIINIVTKKNRKAGTSGVLQANAGNGGRYNLNLSGSYNDGPIDLSGGLGVRQDVRQRGNAIDTLSTDPVTGAVTRSAQTIRQHESRLGVSGKASLDYQLNDKQTLSLAADYMTRHEVISNQEHTVTSGAGASAFDRTGHGSGPRSDGNASLGFEQKLAHDGETLAFNLQTGQTLESNLFTYVTTATAPDSMTTSRQYGREIYGVSEFSTDYVRPFASGSTLKLGYDGEYDRTAFDNSVDAVVDNLFRYHQTIHALYGTFDKKWNKVELLTGLRYEQTDIRTAQNLSGDTSAQAYGKLYPTLNLLYTLSDNDTLTGGFSRRIQRRDPEDLNPYINASDPHNLRQGNPNLRPQITNSWELGYRHDAGGQSLGLTGYYRQSRDGDTETLTVISPDVVLITEANLPSSRSGGVEFIASGKLIAKLGYNVSGNVFYNEVNAQALGVAGLRSAVALNTKASLDYQASSKDRWQVSANYNGKRLTAQGYVLPVATVNAGFRHQVDDKVAIVATVSDLFNSQHQKRFYQAPGFEGTYRRRQGGQLVYVGLVYTFGAPKKSKDAGFTYEQ